MEWDGPRTGFSFWTPSLPSLERRLPLGSPLVSSYRLIRVTWLAFTLPLHVTIVLVSLVVSHQIDRDFICQIADIHPSWNAQQRLVYPLLRRAIWAIADIGSADALTPNARFKFPWWAWALEEFPVRIGRGARVDLEAKEVTMPQTAWNEGWVQDTILDPVGEVKIGSVPCFWFDRADQKPRRDRSKPGRCVLYFVGGGYVTGSPTEGSRCFKIARETGLPVLGANFRKATSPELAFPAQLQDALTVYAHLVLDCGYRDIILAGDSAGGNLALMLVQYLAELADSPTTSSRTDYTTTIPAKQPLQGLVLPTGILLFSPWCDFTATTYGEALRSRRGTSDDPVHDIICASMATNSIRLFLARVLRSSSSTSSGSGNAKRDSLEALQGAHPWFSPALPTASASWSRVARVYSAMRADDKRTDGRSTELRVLVTTGSTELFNLEVLRLIENLRQASQGEGKGGGGGAGRGGGIDVRCLSGEGEVHAFPLVPEWVSPDAGRAWRVIRGWMSE